MAEVERQAKHLGVPALRVTVIRQREALIASYERRGFVRTGGPERFPYDEPRVGRALRDGLVLVILEKPL